MTYSPFVAGQALTAAQENAVAGYKASKVYTASGTFTSTDLGGKATIRVRVWGAGGGSGGCNTTIAANSAASADGGNGGCAESVIDASTLTLPVTVTIGAAGTAGAAAAGGGGTGGTSSFGALVVATGGIGGQGCATGAAIGYTAAGGAGGTGTAGDIGLTGAAGGHGLRIAAGTCCIGVGSGLETTHATSSGVATAGTRTQGATGVFLNASTGQQAGAAGGAGLIVVEFI